MLLRWEQKDLAAASGVSLASIKRLETQPGALAAQPRTAQNIQEAIENAQVTFTNTDFEEGVTRVRRLTISKF